MRYLGYKRTLFVCLLLSALLGCSEQEAQSPASQPTASTEQQTTNMAEPSGSEGQSIYKANCSSCHDTGLSGAPELGDRAAWSSLLAKDREILVQNAVNGIGRMPAKGGNPALSDAQVRSAVDYMLEQVQ